MSNKIPLLVTGAHGLVGSRFTALFADKYDFEILELTGPNPTDITNESSVLERFTNSSATSCVHFAAYTDVTGAWNQRDDTSGVAYQVNVVGTKNISAAARATGKHIVHLSTAYVFDGTKSELYTEADTPNPIEWYGKTKALAEELLLEAQHPWTILRIDQPFRPDHFSKTDIVHAFISKIEANTAKLFTDHFFGPTFIDDFAKVLDFVVETKLRGLFHATSGEKWSDFELGTAIQEILQLAGTVSPVSLDEYLKTLDRPYQRNTALSTAKLVAQLPFQTKTIREALQSIEI